MRKGRDLFIDNLQPWPLGILNKWPTKDRILETVRLMAWERAKAELYSMLATYHEMTEEYEILETHIGEFVERMEDRL